MSESLNYANRDKQTDRLMHSIVPDRISKELAGNTDHSSGHTDHKTTFQNISFFHWGEGGNGRVYDTTDRRNVNINNITLSGIGIFKKYIIMINCIKLKVLKGKVRNLITWKFVTWLVIKQHPVFSRIFIFFSYAILC